MKEKVLLKDTLFNTEKVHKIVGEIKEVYSDFDQKSFELKVIEQFPYR